MRRIHALRYFAAAFAVSAALSLVSFAQAAAGGAPPKPAAAQREWPAEPKAMLMAEWLRARNWTKEYLDKMPEEGYAHKAVPEVRSFAEQMIHLASANFFYAAQASGQQMPVNRADLTPEKYKTKADVTKLVLDSYDFMINAVKGMDMAKLAETQNFRNTTISRMGLVRNGFEHQTHHRGQTTIYLRMKGVTPPPEPFQ